MSPKTELNLNLNNQQYFLKWSDFSSNFMNSFLQMAVDQNFVDATLACEGSSIQVHKVVLSASSNYFKELFLSNPCKHPIVIFNDIKMVDLKAIVDFMYKGEISVFQSQLNKLLKIGRMFKIKGLTEVEELETNLEKIKVIPCKSDAHFLERYSSNSLEKNQMHSYGQILNNRRQKRKSVVYSFYTSSESELHSEVTSDDENGNLSCSIEGCEETNNSKLNTSTESISLSKRHFSNQNHTLSKFQNDQNRPKINDGNLNYNSDLWHEGEEIDISSQAQDSTAINKNKGDQNYDSISGKSCVCNFCDASFTAYSSLRRHIKRHYSDPERYECDICFKSYSRKDYLKEHKKLKHKI